MDYEQLATSAVIEAVSKTSRLKAFINNGDKEPSFDGHIYIYNDNRETKKNIRRVAVQIKGKGVNSVQSQGIKYPISCIDLDNYMKNGGVMFFVVYINKRTGSERQIFYAALLPFGIKQLMNGAKNGNKSISVKFSRFPDDEIESTELFLNFYKEAQKQISFIGKEIPSIEKLKKEGLLESFTFSYTSLKENQGLLSYPRLLNGKDMYIYANVKGGVAPIPVEHYSGISHVHIGFPEATSIGVKSHIYFSQVEKIITADKITYKIGSCVTLAFPNRPEPFHVGEPIGVQFNIKIQGTLKQRIKGLDFLIAMLDAKSFELAGSNFPADFPEAELQKMHADEYSEMLASYKCVLAVMERLNIKKALPLDSFSDTDYRKLNSLIAAIENGKPVTNVEGELPFITCMDFGGLHIALLSEKQSAGVYKIWDYFNKTIDVCMHGKNGEVLPTSQYAVMTAKDFQTIDNLNLQSVIDDFKRIEPQQCLADQGNLTMLELLKAYDATQKFDFLEAAKQMFSWLETIQYIEEEVMTLNSLQIIRRQRALNFAEKQTLFDIACESEAPRSRIGALILLDETAEATKLLDDLSKEERDEFMSFPIYNFYKKSVEETQNGQA